MSSWTRSSGARLEHGGGVRMALVLSLIGVVRGLVHELRRCARRPGHDVRCKRSTDMGEFERRVLADESRLLSLVAALSLSDADTRV
jgi:hypothetical protein